MKKYRIKRVYNHPNYQWIPQWKTRWGLFWNSWTHECYYSSFKMAFASREEAEEFIRQEIDRETQEANPNNRTAYFDV